MTARADLLHAFHKAGLRLDDAGTAADVAVKHQRAQRDALMVSARRGGLSIRQIAAIVDIDPAYVHRVLTRAGIKSTAAVATMAVRPAGEHKVSRGAGGGRTADSNNSGTGGAG